MAVRVYYVVNKAGGERLVEAATPAQAVRHAAQDDYTVVVASQRRCVDMGQAGFQVEVAGEEPASADEPAATDLPDDLVSKAEAETA